MKPSKTAYATKKKPAKRKLHGDEDYIHDSNPIVSKLLKLKYRINDAFNSRQENMGKTKSDKTWVMEEIDNLKNGGWLTATKMKVANEMWSKYGQPV